jgi:hypothetical protein
MEAVLLKIDILNLSTRYQLHRIIPPFDSTVVHICIHNEVDSSRQFFDGSIPANI